MIENDRVCQRFDSGRSVAKFRQATFLSFTTNRFLRSALTVSTLSIWRFSECNWPSFTLF